MPNWRKRTRGRSQESLQMVGRVNFEGKAFTPLKLSNPGQLQFQGEVYAVGDAIFLYPSAYEVPVPRVEPRPEDARRKRNSGEDYTEQYRQTILGSRYLTISEH